MRGLIPGLLVSALMGFPVSAPYGAGVETLGAMASSHIEGCGAPQAHLPTCSYEHMFI